MEIAVETVQKRIAAGERLALIDVREPFEFEAARIDGADLIPMNTIPEHLEELRERAVETPLIVLCHHGVRSLNVVSWLRRQGVENCWSMRGGIDLWSQAVAPGVPRY